MSHLQSETMAPTSPCFQDALTTVSSGKSQRYLTEMSSTPDQKGTNYWNVQTGAKIYKSRSSSCRLLITWTPSHSLHITCSQYGLSPVTGHNKHSSYIIYTLHLINVQCYGHMVYYYYTKQNLVCLCSFS